MDLRRLQEVTAELNRTTSDDIVGVGMGYKEKDGKTTNEKCITFTVIRKKPLSEIPENERIPPQIEIDGEIFNTDVTEGTYKLRSIPTPTTTEVEPTPTATEEILPTATGVEPTPTPTWIDCPSSDPDFYTWQSTPPGNRDKIRPLQGGISLSNLSQSSLYFSTGTLGFIAVDNDTNSLVGVTNNHVIINDAFFASNRLDTIYTSAVTNVADNITTQPNESLSRSLLNRIGVVKKYQPIVPTTDGFNLVDTACLALEQIDGDGNTVISESDSWKQYGISGMTSAPRFATTSEIDAALQEPNRVFYGTGRTTGDKGEGITKLYCTSYSTSTSLTYERQGQDVTCFMNDTFELSAKGPDTPEGDWCEYPSHFGDSGSAVLTVINGEYVIIGLLFAGIVITSTNVTVITVCCRIDHVAQALNISAWDGSLTNVSFSDTANSETIIIEGKSNQKIITVNGKQYWQVGVTSESPT